MIDKPLCPRQGFFFACDFLCLVPDCAFFDIARRITTERHTKPWRKMVAHSNYSDAKMGGLEASANYAEFPLHINGARRFNPAPGTSDASGPLMSLLSEGCQGDWSWKPARNKSFAQFEMPALRAGLGGMPEQLGRAREAAGERSATHYGNAVLPIRRNPKIIPGVNGGKFDTQSGCHA